MKFVQCPVDVGELVLVRLCRDQRASLRAEGLRLTRALIAAAASPPAKVSGGVFLFILVCVCVCFHRVWFLPFDATHKWVVCAVRFLCVSVTTLKDVGLRFGIR